MAREVIEEDDSVTVADTDTGEMYEFKRTSEGIIPETDNIPIDVIEWVVDETAYEVAQSIDFPVQFQYTLHLEDGPDYAFLIENDDRLPDGFENEIDLNYELNTHWVVTESGDMRLQRVEYDGEVFTPISDNER